MGREKIMMQAALVLAICTAHAASAHAFALTGLWASDSEACDKIFAKKGGKASLRKDSEMFGSGFIVEGNRIRGRTAACTIKSTKEDKGVIHLMTACATDIMLSNVQFSIKVVDDDRISRIFPGIDDITLDYVRCPAGRAAR